MIIRLRGVFSILLLYERCSAREWMALFGFVCKKANGKWNEIMSWWVNKLFATTWQEETRLYIPWTETDSNEKEKTMKK